MKTKILIIGLGFLVYSCSVTNKPNNEKITEYNNQLYTVYRIDSINNYNLIYAKKQDLLYKIVSEKKKNKNCKIKIDLNKEYLFKLHSLLYQDIYINGVNVGGGGWANCVKFNDTTNICIEKDSILDLHVAENIKGLCYKD